MDKGRYIQNNKQGNFHDLITKCQEIKEMDKLISVSLTHIPLYTDIRTLPHIPYL